MAILRHCADRVLELGERVPDPQVRCMLAE